MPEKDELIVVQNLQPKINTNPKFQEIVASIKTTLDRAEPLLKVPLSELDEDELKATMAELKDIQTRAKLIEGARNHVKKTLDNNTKKIIGQLDEILNSAGYNKLLEVNTKIKQRKNDQINERKDKRWKELRKHWFKLMKNVYTNIDPTRDLATMMPNITFTEFQQQHLKMVSGAKTRDIREKDLQVISDYLNGINNDFQAILALNSPYQNQLIDYYQSTRDLPTVLSYAKQLDEQAKLAAQEKQRQLEATKNADIQKTARANEAIQKLQQEQAAETLQKQQALKAERDRALGVKETVENNQTATAIQNPNLTKLAAIWTELQKAAKAGVTEEHAKVVVKHIKQILNN